MSSLKNQTIIITGATRGIGREMAIKFAKEKANIVIAGKSTTPNEKLPGTIYSVAKEVEDAGGTALPFKVDVRLEEEVESLIAKTLTTFGQIDVVIQNAGAIRLTNVENTPVKSYDLMQSVNARGAFLLTKFAIEHLAKSKNPHVLFMSPPVSLDEKWFVNHTPYTLSKFNMSMLARGLAAELKDKKIAVNTLWPKTLIATAAIDLILDQSARKQCRLPSIVADAAYEIIQTTNLE